MTESEIFESVTGSGSTDFATLVGILDRQSSWCLIGGLAVNCYVGPVYSLDADVVLANSELPPTKVALITAGFGVEEFTHYWNARMADSDLRIQFSLDPRYQDFLGNTEVHTVLNQQVPVASLENVIKGKVWAWKDPNRRLSKRKKDELDLIRILESYPHVAELMPNEIRQQVAEQ